MKKKDQGGAKTSKQLSDPVLLVDTTEYCGTIVQLLASVQALDSQNT